MLLRTSGQEKSSVGKVRILQCQVKSEAKILEGKIKAGWGGLFHLRARQDTIQKLEADVK